MAFVPITDLKEADKLWEAGLLWYKYPDDTEWEVDDTYQIDDSERRGRNAPTYADYVDYAILVEE